MVRSAMKTERESPASRGFDRDELERILERISGQTELSSRLDKISAYFLGRPYVEGSLGGGVNLPEVLSVSLDAFDCVTYIETVLALALSETADDFIEAIRRIRYADGRVDWFHRNHYMIDWAPNNQNAEFIADITSGPDTAEKTCRLSLIPGLPTKTATFRYFPTENISRAEPSMEAGDLIFFVSAKPALDVFHTGLLVERGGAWLMRHAARTAGAVIEQELREFIDRNSMLGVILLRPLCQR